MLEQPDESPGDLVDSAVYPALEAAVLPKPDRLRRIAEGIADLLEAVV
jgi:hypothetical protein